MGKIKLFFSLNKLKNWLNITCYYLGRLSLVQSILPYLALKPTFVLNALNIITSFLSKHPVKNIRKRYVIVNRSPRIIMFSKFIEIYCLTMTSKTVGISETSNMRIIFLLNGTMEVYFFTSIKIVTLSKTQTNEVAKEAPTNP